MNKIVKIVSHSGPEVTVETYKEDTEDQDFYSPPNFVSIPLPDEECIQIETARKGESPVALTPMDGGIEPGETKVVWRDSAGAVKGTMYGKADGTLEFDTGSGAFSVTSLSGVAITGAGGVELVALLIELVTALTALTVDVAGAPTPLTGASVSILTNILNKFNFLLKKV